MTIGENHELSFFIAMKVEHMQENKNEQNIGTKTIKKIGKVTYEVVVHFNENATETMQDKLKRVMLMELRRKSDEKKMLLIKNYIKQRDCSSGARHAFIFEVWGEKGYRVFIGICGLILALCGVVFLILG